MIVTLTPNPSLDLTYELDEMLRGEVQRAVAVSVEAGGKGINVSRNLVANGVDSRAVAPVGGPSGQQFLSLLEESGIQLARVPVNEPVRANISIVEREGVLTKINAAGPNLSNEEVDHLLQETVAAGHGADWVAACGSLPPGAPKDLLARVVTAAREAGSRAAVDSSGAPLIAALGARPDLLKPNLEELSEIAGRRLTTFGDVLGAAKEVLESGVATVFVSLGADGAVLVDESGARHADTPPFTPRSTVGAGDALLAGFLAAGGEGEAALVEGVAWGAAAARLPGSKTLTPSDIDRAAVRVHNDINEARLLKGEAPR
ncbi:MAG TPA: 1-phosphofructokinase [Rubrobacteraceae bacterium]|nr:1-phosphofructokinase [Rubrobacteraceae bacterium]